MNSQIFILVLIAMVMGFGIVRAKMGIRKDAHGNHIIDDNREAQALREEIAKLRERVQTLETIATDTNLTLDRQIERLRDR